MLDISVCVVVYNAMGHIQECLDSLMALEYPQEHFEVLFIDNNSTDGTKELLQYYDTHYPHVRTLINPVLGIAGSRNLALKRAHFDYVAFTDSDCVVPPNWLSKLANGFEKYSKEEPSLVAVGGSNSPPKHTSLFYDTLDLMLNTFLGSHGSVQGRRFDKDRYVPHIPTVNIMYHKPTVLRAGGFDVTFGNIAEDRDLSYRLEKFGHRFIYLTDTVISHKLRPTWQSWLKNMYVYGKGRMWLMRKHPDKIDVMLFAPVLLIFSMLFPFLSFIAPYFALPLFYFPCLLAASMMTSLRAKRIVLTPMLFLLYVGTHFAYGLGQIAGLFRNREFYRLESSKALVVKAERGRVD